MHRVRLGAHRAAGLKPSPKALWRAKVEPVALAVSMGEILIAAPPEAPTTTLIPGEKLIGEEIAKFITLRLTPVPEMAHSLTKVLLLQVPLVEVYPPKIAEYATTDQGMIPLYQPVGLKTSLENRPVIIVVRSRGHSKMATVIHNRARFLDPSIRKPVVKREREA